MLALFAVVEHLTSVRRLLNKFNVQYKKSAHSANLSINDEDTLSDSFSFISEQQQHDILLGPVLNKLLKDNRLEQFNEDFRDDLHQNDYIARELDACLLEMREIERDLYNLKQRQCYFYERYVDFIDKKDELIDQFIEYYDNYILNNSQEPLTPRTKQLRRQSTIYEFNIPVSNRFELLKRQQTQNLE